MNFHGLIFSVRPIFNARGHGAYRIAHVVREDGWDIEVIDYTIYWSVDQLKQLARSRITNNTKWIGIGLLFSAWSPTMEEFFLWIKQEWPHLIIICGAPTKPSFKSQAIDYYIQGYAENAVIALLKYLFSNGTRPRFDLLKINSRPIILANDTYPTHPVKNLMVRYEDRDFIHPGEFLGVEFSRGCKFSCAFCNYPILGVKGDYSRDPADFRLQMMDTYDRFGVTNYVVTDETFNDRTEKITKFANVVETLPFQPWFSGCLRADLMVSRPKDQEELLRMNFLGHFYGIETFHPTAAKAVGKGMNPDKLKQGLIDIKNYFESNGRKLYRGHISIIVGLPGEDFTSLQQTKDWLKTHWHSSTPNFLRIFSHENAKKSKMSEDYEKYGYSVIDENTFSGSSWDHEVVGELEDTIIWQNQHMNVFQAHKFTNNWKYQNMKKNSKVLLCPVTDLIRPHLSELSIEERLKLNWFDMVRMKKTNYGFIDRYIEKKLNL